MSEAVRKLGRIGPNLSESERKKRHDAAEKRGSAHIQDCLFCSSKDIIPHDWDHEAIPDAGHLKGLVVGFNLCENHRNASKADIQESLKNVTVANIGSLDDKEKDIFFGADTTAIEGIIFVQRKAEKLRKDFPDATIEEVASYLVQDPEMHEGKNFIRVVLESLEWYGGWPLVDREGGDG